MENVSWVQLDTGLVWVVSSLELFDGYCLVGAIEYRIYTVGINIANICWLVLAVCIYLQDLHGLYHILNYLMDSVS
jgi:hypothetical protein